MEQFAKLFETEDYGQILVKFDGADNGPELRFYFKPEGLGVCSIAISADDTEKGWDAMEAAFIQQTSDSATNVVAGAMREMGN